MQSRFQNRGRKNQLTYSGVHKHHNMMSSPTSIDSVALAEIHCPANFPINFNVMQQHASRADGKMKNALEARPSSMQVVHGDQNNRRTVKN